MDIKVLETRGDEDFSSFYKLKLFFGKFEIVFQRVKIVSMIVNMYLSFSSSFLSERNLRFSSMGERKLTWKNVIKSVTTRPVSSRSRRESGN